MVVPAGPKVYFSNFVFTLIRSGKERSSNEVVFRVPRVMNKLDIEQYLERLYGLRVANIRIQNFLSKTTRNGRNYIPGRKNAIITLKDETFTFPPMTDAKLLKFPIQPMQYPKLH
jgi:large subunit ribosomal protein L23